MQQPTADARQRGHAQGRGGQGRATSDVRSMRVRMYGRSIKATVSRTVQYLRVLQEGKTSDSV